MKVSTKVNQKEDQKFIKGQSKIFSENYDSVRVLLWIVCRVTENKCHSRHFAVYSCKLKRCILLPLTK